MVLAWYRFRAGLRRRWRGYLSAALVLGLVGGVALAAIAGARRTASAHGRFLRNANSSTMAINSGIFDQHLEDAVKALPQVSASATYVAFDGLFFRPDGRELDVANSAPAEFVGSLDGRYFTQDRFAVLRGRMADANGPDEVVLDEASARLTQLHVGDRRILGVWDDKDLQSPGFFDHPTAPKDRLTVTVVGIGLFTDEVIQDDQDRQPRVLLTPAFTRRNLPWKTYAWQGVTLKAGDADVDAVKRSFVSLLPPGYPQFFRVTSVDAAHAQRSIRPLAVALGVFGGIAFLVALVLAGQTLVRQISLERDDMAVLRAMGASPRATAGAALPGASVTVLTGTGLAVAAAVALSPLSPIGPVRRVAVRSDLSFDWTVLVAGGLGLAGTLILFTAVMSWRRTPHREQIRGGRRATQASIIVATAGASGLPAPAVAGIHMALRTDESRTSTPVRSTMVGSAVAVVALVAAMCFAQSMSRLIHHPSLYGWNWDASLLDQVGYGNINVDQAHAVLDHDPAVTEWSGVYFGSGSVGGANTPMLGMDPKSSVTPPILSGRSIASTDEIILGPVTLASLHRRVGDTVAVGEGTRKRTVHIVGTATFPAMGVAHGLHTSLGTGALVEPQLVPGATISITGAGKPGPNAVFVRFRPGVNAVGERAHLQQTAGVISDLPGALEVDDVQRPAEIVNYVGQGTAPALLAGGLCLAAAISLALTLGSSVRRRRRDLALLKALGFTRGQISSTVAWQATATISVGLVVGIPLGIAIGRWLWILFAHQLSVVPSTVVPVVPLIVAALGLLVLANIAAAVPAITAARTPTAALLGSQ